WLDAVSGASATANAIPGFQREYPGNRSYILPAAYCRTAWLWFHQSTYGEVTKSAATGTLSSIESLSRVRASPDVPRGVPAHCGTLSDSVDFLRSFLPSGKAGGIHHPHD